MDSFLIISRLSKNYSHGPTAVAAIEDLSITLIKGEIVSIVGPSGCGKTTLLRIIAGLISSTVGTVEIAGVDPQEYRREGGIGFVFQKPTLFPWRTVMDNILLPVEIRGTEDQEESLRRARLLLSKMGLSGFEKFYPRHLSGGMLQRTAVARLLMAQPQLLLLDEPFSALDELTREQLWVDFGHLWRQQGLTVLLVTHSIREAVFLGDRVLSLSRRPGHVIGETAVNLPNSRNRDMLNSQRFIEICEEVRRKTLQ